MLLALMWALVGPHLWREPIDCRVTGLAGSHFDLLFGSSCKKWSQVSHTGNLKLGRCYVCCGGLLFLSLNYLVMSVKKFPASGFLYWTVQNRCLLSFGLFCVSVFVLSTVICKDAVAFSNLLFYLWCKLLLVFVLCSMFVVNPYHAARDYSHAQSSGPKSALAGTFVCHQV